MSSATDLDAFLTQLESKLRAPFASLLDIGPPKKNEDHATYLAQLGAVLPRAEKVTQLRALIGLLASSASQQDAVLQAIVTAAQEAPVYEEWVRVIAAIVEEMLFSDEDNTDREEEEEERKRENNLRKTCMEILDRLRKLATDDEMVDDADPLFVPYRCHIVPPSLLQSVLPETSAHTHFSVHAAADILHMDALPELQKGEPEAERPPNGGGGIPPPSATATTAAARPVATIAPPRKPAVVRPKSSMFLPSTKPRTLATTAKPTGLHQRKAALSLVLKGRRAGRTVPHSAVPGRAVPDARGKASKMKLLDVTEVQDLEQQQQSKAKVEPTDVARGRKSTLLAGKKRPLPEARPVEPTNAAVAEEPPAPTETPAAAGDLATAALLAYQQQAAQPRRDSKKQQDWRQLLQERSNRLSDDDRRRIQQFFVDRVNPTPGSGTKYKMKVHEERTTDAATGRAMKETYYLELDYTNFTSTQTKKVKRYGDDA